MVQRLVFPRRVEARTGLLRVQVAMPHNQCAGEALFQSAEQCSQTAFLCRRAGVARKSVGIQSAFVADADGVPVVFLAVGARQFRRPAAVHRSVARDVVVITDVAKAAMMNVVVPASLEIQAPPFGSGGAMDNKQGNDSHTKYMFPLVGLSANRR